MSSRKALVAAVAALVVIVLIFTGRGWIASLSYHRAADRLSSRLPQELRAKYGGELEYTLDKFWECYDADICSRNDMTDVMDRMRRLSSGTEIDDGRIFDFIEFVSSIYTRRIEEHHREQLREPGS